MSGVNLSPVYADLEGMVPDPIIIILGLAVHNFDLVVRHLLASLGLA